MWHVPYFRYGNSWVASKTMTKQKSKLIKILRGGDHGPTFSPLDQIDFKMKICSMLSVESSMAIAKICENDELIDEVKSVLLAGTAWEWNPTCAMFRNKKTRESMYDKKILSKYMEENGRFKLKELDVNNSYLEAIVPLSVLVGNIKDIPDKIFLESPSIKVHTFLGKIKVK